MRSAFSHLAWFFALAAGLTSCGGGPVPEPRLPGEPEAITGLVWFLDSSGRDRTLWVSVDDGHSLAGQPIDGPVWAQGPHLWQWIEETVDVPLYDCTDPEAGESVGTAELSRVVLNELTERASVELRPLPSIEASRSASHRIHPVASVGPYLFVVEELSIDACGAHGWTEARAIVWDLRAGQEARVLTPRERWSVSSVEERTARALLIEESEGIEASDVELAALWPTWVQDCGLELEYLFVMEVCNACSDGEWGSYARATRVPAVSMPSRLAPHARVPPWVWQALALNGGGTLLGFTTVSHPRPSMILDTLRR